MSLLSSLASTSISIRFRTTWISQPYHWIDFFIYHNVLFFSFMRTLAGCRPCLVSSSAIHPSGSLSTDYIRMYPSKQNLLELLQEIVLHLIIQKIHDLTVNAEYNFIRLSSRILNSYLSLSWIPAFRLYVRKGCHLCVMF